MKKAILVPSFGTSCPETLEKTIAAIERDITDEFTDYEVRRAFTSEMIRAKLKKRDNMETDNVATALERLADDGFSNVIIQPTHIINGFEYEKITSGAAPYTGRFDSLKIGAPLLSSVKDYFQVTAALGQADGDGGCIVFVGHGTSHPADSAYAALDYHFKAAGFPHIFVGALDGYPDIDTVCKAVSASGYKKVVFIPLMVVAGDHAVNDIAGDEEDSWKSVFENHGFAVRCELKGLGEWPEIRSIYRRHIYGA